MQAVRDRPLFARYTSTLVDFVPSSGSAYVYASSVEERSQIPEQWLTAHSATVRFVHIFEQSADDASFKASIIQGGQPLTVSLRSRSQLSGFVDALDASRVYLDFTGLDHSMWAGILRALLAKRVDTRAVYIEPQEYAYSKAPTEGEIFDLSERIRGLEPIPGFASLQSAYDEFVFVPLLGFEGARLAYMLEQLQPESDNIYPVIGLPGFRPEYLFHAYWGNKASLLSSRAWKQVRFAKANCPFSLFYVLSDIAKLRPGTPLRIAPIGTKPHALGAVLYALAGRLPQTQVELVYDHPIRKAKRTSGASRAAVYYVSSFLPGI